MRLEGKVAIVTGAASGMGAAIAARFAAEGARVACLDINRDGGEAVVRKIHDTGGRAEFIRCDVSDGEDVRGAVGQTVRRFGKLHILVNNAGIYDHDDHLIEDLTEETWDRVMGVNLKGPFYCCRYALPEIVTCGGGAVVNIASTAALAAVAAPDLLRQQGGAPHLHQGRRAAVRRARRPRQRDLPRGRRHPARRGNRGLARRRRGRLPSLRRA